MSEAQLRAAVNAVSILPDWSLEWLGRPVKCYGDVETVPEAVRPEVCGTQLEEILYSSFYTSGRAVHLDDAAHQPEKTAMADFSRFLEEANHGSGCLDGGWQVVSVKETTAVLHGYGITITVPLTEGMLLEAGQWTNILRPKGSFSISPGFYFAYGNTAMVENDPVVRVYWHLAPLGALQLVDCTTRLLNEAGMPFHLKVLSNPADYQRADAGVLYLPKSRFPAVLPALLKIVESGVELIRPETPAFTRRLAPGVGLAEDPGDGASFGMHRCRLVAAALVEARVRGVDGESRADYVASFLRERGVDPQALHLIAGSSDIYEPPAGLRLAAACLPMEDSSRNAAYAPPVQVAAEIATRLMDSALWHGERCNWIGISRDNEDGNRILWKSLDASFYEGTAGIGVFLAEFAAETGDGRARRTAVAALRHSAKRVDGLRGNTQCGFHVGWPGVAYAAFHAGRILGEEELLALAEETVRNCLAWPEDHAELDLISGRAGLLFALSLMGLNGPATPVAERVLGAAEPMTGGIAWRSPGKPLALPLAGFSHGASGIATALLEYGRLKPSAQLRQAAESAFHWERTFFDEARSNWADAREMARLDMPNLTDAHFMTAWCHGAPGIALARTRAWEVLGDECFREEALTALATTRSDVATAVRFGGRASLCHSPLGNADILAWCRSRLELEVDPLVAECGYVLREQARKSGFWQCDFTTSTPPGLMTGLAGVGLFFLRLHNPSVSSALLPKSWAESRTAQSENGSAVGWGLPSRVYPAPRRSCPT